MNELSVLLRVLSGRRRTRCRRVSTRCPQCAPNSTARLSTSPTRAAAAKALCTRSKTCARNSRLPTGALLQYYILHVNSTRLHVYTIRYGTRVRVRSESAALRQEVRDTVAEMADYKQQVQSYALEVKRIQDSLAAKEGERSNLLEQYRLLSLEADRFQSQSHQAIAQ